MEAIISFSRQLFDLIDNYHHNFILISLKYNSYLNKISLSHYNHILISLQSHSYLIIIKFLSHYNLILISLQSQLISIVKVRKTNPSRKKFNAYKTARTTKQARASRKVGKFCTVVGVNGEQSGQSQVLYSIVGVNGEQSGQSQVLYSSLQ